jgi:molybdate transport system substrate-binding protein
VRRRLAAAAALVAAAGGLASCGSSGKPRLTVFAAASLTNVLPRIDSGERYSFGGSNAAATQIEQGQAADVFASANTQLPQALYAKGLVAKPVDFTANELVIVVGKGNPLGLRGVRSLERPGVKVVMAAPGVPVGDYTRESLGKLGRSDLVRKAVSQETDVRAVLAKVTLGEADAGFVYATDARTVAGKTLVLHLPAKAQPTVVYAAAAVKASRHLQAAEAWVDNLRSRHAQRFLRAAGFLPVPRR